MAPSDNKQQKNQAHTEVAPKNAPVTAPAGAAPGTELKPGPIELVSEGPSEKDKQRAEIERLREENEQLYESTELARLKAENARLKRIKAEAEKAVLEDSAAAKEEEPCFRNAKGQLVPERFRGTKTYRLKQPHYRGGDYLQAGETITVTDEKPSKTWELVKPRTVNVAPPVEPEQVERPSDMSV